jgi:hypothetical protein
MQLRESRGLAVVELVGVLAAGGIHVLTELTTSLAVSRVYNAAVCVLFVGYAVWRVKRDRAVLRSWGFRTDNLLRGMPAYALLVVLAAPAIYGVGALLGAEPALAVSPLVLYLGWGLAQQFALQNLLARNLEVLIARGWLSAALASVLFAASHVPRFELVAAACVGGFAFVHLYRRFPNLPAAGIAHGVLGWMIFGFWGLE